MSRSRIRISFAHSLTLLVSFAAVLTTQSSVLRGDEKNSGAEASEIESLLVQARQAMAANDLEKAALLLQRAEHANVPYPTLHFGDTPERVRRDLDKLAALRQSTSPSATPVLQNSAAKETFLSALREGGSLPSARPANTGISVAHLAVPQTAPQQNQSQAAAKHLLAARRALVVGDVRQAEQFVTQAQQTATAFAPGEDSPEQVMYSVREYYQLQATKSDSDVWRQTYAKFLLSQANRLVDHGDLDRAEMVTHEVLGLKAEFDVSESTAHDVLRRITEVRSGQALQQAKPLVPQSISQTKSQAQALMVQARQALSQGNLQEAERLTTLASRLNIGEHQFAANEDSPAKLAADLQRTRAEADSIQLAISSSGASLRLPGPVQSQESPAEIPHVAAAEPVPAPLPPTANGTSAAADPYAIISQGENALRSGNRREALELFQLALEQSDQLDLLTQSRLRDHLQMMSVEAPQKATRQPAEPSSLLQSTDANVSVLAKQLSVEVGRQQTEAAKMRSTDPDGALQLLEEISKEVEDSELDEGLKRQLKRRISLTVAETEKYIRDNKSELELEAANRKVMDDIERGREVKLQVQQRLAELNDQYIQLRNEHRYAEMELVAKRAVDMAPEEPVARLMWNNAKFLRREMLNQEIEDDSEAGVYGMLSSVQRSKANANLHGDKPIDYDVDTWEKIANRQGSSKKTSRRTARELEIQKKLSTPVRVNFEDTPLSEVIEQLSQLTDINIYLDPRGLSQEGWNSDTTVSLPLEREVSLESALNLILEPLHLTHMIDDEVLKITSEQLRDGEVYPEVYNVADLVIPIPNFMPSSNIGLQGLINDAYAALPQNVRNQPGPVSMVPSAMPAPPDVDGGMPGGVLPQQFGAPGAAAIADYGNAPGGAGGAANADFDSLIDLIVSTVEHDSWMENGTGDGEIQPFPTNLSLVISQTQRVHEQIADLLEQLRRLQDLQVTIEVRFIRLSDSFFERIGIDFDFNIEDGSGLVSVDTDTSPTEPSSPSATLGISANPTTLGDPLGDFTLDLDIPYRNNSFDLTAPAFGTPVDVANFGFAILSDIEAYFLIEASQGNSRSNVLSAPKVTLFNGQQAAVFDTSFQPFVISVIPVVGEFAAAQQPVIVVLSEGTMLTVQAVISDDRRYVRLTLVPFFSQIGDVDTFTFEGSETTSTSSGSSDEDDDGNDESNNDATEIIRSGTTVQLPTFEVISVQTTVSVPDGGTVLLGGIKRLSEGRNEFGVPLLSKVPYIDRLFRNVGIGRDTDSLMMMVTPHIIIQEEEEERLGIE